MAVTTEVRVYVASAARAGPARARLRVTHREAGERSRFGRGLLTLVLSAAGSLSGMPRVLVSEPTPPAVQALLDQRRRAGADTHDEMWNGVLHMAPAPRDVHAVLAHQIAVVLDPVARAAGLVVSAEFNLGSMEDYRVPDIGLHREQSWGTYAATAVLVVEVLSPGDETWEKLPFYAAHDVDELIVVDHDQCTVRWLALTAAGYDDVERSTVVDLGADELADRLDWPAVS